MIERKYPVNYWISMYLIPDRTEFEPFFGCMETGDFGGAMRAIDACDTDDMHRALMKSLLFQSVGEAAKALRVLEQYRGTKDFYVNRNLFRLYSSLSMVDDARGAVEALVPENEEMRAIVLNAEGSLMWRSGRNELAKERFEQAFELAKRCNNSMLLSSCIINRALMLQCFGNAAEAEKWYIEAMSIAKSSGIVENVLISELDLGELYKETGRTERAKEALLSAIEYSKGYESYTISSIRRDCYVNLGDILYMEKEFDRAEEFYERAISEEFDETSDIARAYTGKARIAMEKGELSEALELLEKAYDFARQARSARYEAETFLLKGMIHERQNRLNEALQSYGVAIFLFRRLGNIYEIARAEKAVGEIYMRLGDEEKASEHLKRANELFAYLTGESD